jgi:2-amino-4-hydroxy-6-hydroxymethyldihydropteridine diphosphokinase
MVVEVKTLHSPRDLLKRIQTIEAGMGRTGSRNEPRSLDIDIISLGSFVVNEEDLIIPHPRFHKRAFVLIPLRAIAPGYRCPARGKNVDELLSSLSGRESVDLVSTRKLVYI